MFSQMRFWRILFVLNWFNFLIQLWLAYEFGTFFFEEFSYRVGNRKFMINFSFLNVYISQRCTTPFVYIVFYMVHACDTHLIFNELHHISCRCLEFSFWPVSHIRFGYYQFSKKYSSKHSNTSTQQMLNYRIYFTLFLICWLGPNSFVFMCVLCKHNKQNVDFFSF